MLINLSAIFGVRQRFVMVFLCFTIITETYVSRRTVVSVIHKKEGYRLTPNSSEDICFQKSEHVETQSTAEHEATKKLHNELMSFYYWASGVSAAPGGFMADKIGGRILLLGSLLFSSGIQMVTPVVLDNVSDSIVMKLLRFVHGVVHGVRVPVVTSVLAHWLPKNERTFLAPIVFCGAAVAMVLDSCLTEYLIHTKRISAAFYLYGSVSAVLAVLWWLSAGSDPLHCPYISKKEKLYLSIRLRNTIAVEKRYHTPVLRILLSPCVWAFVSAHASAQMLWNFLSLLIKTYMRDIFRLDRPSRQTWASLPFSVMIVLTVVASYLAQRALNRGYFSLSTVRRHFCNVAAMGPPIFLLAASFAGCNMHLAFGCLIVATTMTGFTFCGILLLSMDIAPNYAGVLCGMARTVGVVFSVFTMDFVESNATGRGLTEYRRVFWIILAISTCCILVFVFFGHTEVQPWNMPQPKVLKKGRRESDEESMK